jgi:L-lactate dehydrogenase
MRIAIIGGAGRVGVSAAFHLLTERLCRQLVLIDIMEDLLKGEREDLLQCTSVIGRIDVLTSASAEACAGCDVVIIPAGSRRKPDQSRLDLIKINVGIIDSAIETIKRVNRDCIIFIVSNPVDVLTLRAYIRSGFHHTRVIGLGNVVDSVRFRSYLAEHFNWEPRDVTAFLCGEHGDSMVPIWSNASYAGIQFKNLTGVNVKQLEEVYQKTRKTGAEMIRLKGGASWAVGVAIAEVIRAIAFDQKRILPVSSVPMGAYGINEMTCISLPTIVGHSGIEGYADMKFTKEELDGLRQSAKIVAKTYQEVEKA